VRTRRGALISAPVIENARAVLATPLTGSGRAPSGRRVDEDEAAQDVTDQGDASSHVAICRRGTTMTAAPGGGAPSSLRCVGCAGLVPDIAGATHPYMQSSQSGGASSDRLRVLRLAEPPHRQILMLQRAGASSAAGEGLVVALRERLERLVDLASKV